MKKLLMIIACFAIASCTNVIHKKFDVNKHSLSIDAKQRVILSWDTLDGRVVCAEPNPEVYSSVNKSSDSDAAVRTSNIPSINLGLSTDLDETVVEIANRSKTIQLMRDGLYRSCEAYANGAIGREEYKAILNKQDDILIMLVAIEQLGKLYGTKNDEEIFDSENKTAADAVRSMVRDYMCLQADKEGNHTEISKDICK